jgi:hypothetical protein
MMSDDAAFLPNGIQASSFCNCARGSIIVELKSAAQNRVVGVSQDTSVWQKAASTLELVSK